MYIYIYEISSQGPFLAVCHVGSKNTLFGPGASSLPRPIFSIPFALGQASLPVSKKRCRRSLLKASQTVLEAGAQRTPACELSVSGSEPYGLHFWGNTHGLRM